MELHYHAFSGKPFVALIVALFNYGVRAVFTQQFEGTKGMPAPISKFRSYNRFGAKESRVSVLRFASLIRER